jgi:uncharacterized membrane protein (UPF0136 family)
MNIFRIGRIANGILGAWLFLSAVLLDRTDQQAANVAIVGGVVFVVALVALYRLPLLRFINAALAIWVFMSSWIMHGTAATVVNDLTVATLIFGFALIPVDVDPAELRAVQG